MINSASFHSYLEEQLEAGSFQDLRAVAGGDINQSYRIQFNEGPYFLKYRAHAPLDFFAAEADGLTALLGASPLPVPKVVLSDIFEEEPFLVMHFIDQASPSANFDRDLGRGLAQLHRNSSAKFGWKNNNYIGTLTQLNSEREQWWEFYAECRLEPLFAKAFDQGYLQSRDRRSLEALIHRLEELIPPESPALLHGDLWSGNCISNRKGEPLLIDPAVYYGHREMDLAMMKLFGGFSAGVFQAYNEEFPLEKDWEERLSIHQLYPLLVHLNLFGSTYLSSCRRVWAPFA